MEGIILIIGIAIVLEILLIIFQLGNIYRALILLNKILWKLLKKN